MNLRLSARFLLGLTLLLYGQTATAQWQAIAQLQHTNVKCFLAVDDSTILVGGDNWTFLRSTDAGGTWTNVLGGGIVVDTILSLGKGGGFIFAGANGMAGVYRSSDNGATWNPANQGLPSIAQVFAFTYVDSTLYAATNYGVYSTKNQGGSWKVDTAGLGINQPLYPGQIGGTVGITSVRSTLYTIKPEWGGGVYASSTDTIFWTPIGLDTVWGYGIASIDTNVFAGMPQGVFLYSGGGRTWLSRSNGLPPYLSFCILTAVDTLLFAFTGTTADGFYVSSDLGQSWKHITDSIASSSSVRTMIATKSYLIAGTGAGAWRIPIASLVTAVDDHSMELPTGYVLDQNYPNPFNPTTTISFRLPERSLVSLRIFDLVGREVTSRDYGELQAGEYRWRWNAAGLASGVYLCQLRAGGYVQTKKLLLLW